MRRRGRSTAFCYAAGGTLGHELFYETDEHHIGSMSLRRWDEVQKLLPLFVDFVNRAMSKEWRPGTARDIRILEGGEVQPAVPPPDGEAPHGAPFELDKMLSAEHVDMNEVYFFRASEWDRLFAWCAFLEARDGAYQLYAPLAFTLRRGLSEILSEIDA